MSGSTNRTAQGAMHEHANTRLRLVDFLVYGPCHLAGLAASPLLFHRYPIPAELVFEGDKTAPIRARQPCGLF
jgi:hypothetical protein